MILKFWGVRGSIPSPGAHTVKYGGNTICLELRFEGSDRLIIIDAGSGIRELGEDLISRRKNGGRVRAEIFLTHTHLDHILGLPFFTPIYIPGNHFKIYGPITFEEDSLEEVIGGQLSYRYFPVRQEELSATIEYANLKEGNYDLGDGILMTAKYLNHPLLSLGYRFEYRGSIICTAFDTEPFYNVFNTDLFDSRYDEVLAFEGETAAREENLRMEEFVSAADLLIHDGQFTLAEYESGKQGWGHSPMERVIEVGQRAKVKRLALCHHDPNRTDTQIDTLSKRLCSRAFDDDMEVFFARERTTVKIK